MQSGWAAVCSITIGVEVSLTWCTYVHTYTYTYIDSFIHFHSFRVVYSMAKASTSSSCGVMQAPQGPSVNLHMLCWRLRSRRMRVHQDQRYSKCAVCEPKIPSLVDPHTPQDRESPVCHFFLLLEVLAAWIKGYSTYRHAGAV